MKKLFTLILGLLQMGVFAQTPLMENFNFGSTDSLVAVTYNNGWLLVNSTANPLRANATGLTYTGYAGSGIGNAVPLTTSGQDACKDFRNSVNFTSGSVYASFLVNISAAQATGDYFFGMLPVGSVTAFFGRTFVRLSSTGYFRVGISKSSVGANETLVYSNDSFPLNTTYLFVTKYTFNTGSNTDDSCKLYVFSSGVPASEPSVATCRALGGTNTDAANIARVFLRQGTASSAPTLVVDAIRVSNTWGNGPLPVELINFKGERVDKRIHLTWSTAQENNNKGFEIERSQDGIAFESIGFVNGASNSNKTLHYAFEDDFFAGTQVFYRLNQIDMDGNQTNSEVIAVTLLPSEIVVGPNPFESHLNITCTHPGTPVRAEIMDINGKIKLALDGVGNLNLNTNGLESGIYLIRINSGETTSIHRLLKN